MTKIQYILAGVGILLMVAIAITIFIRSQDHPMTECKYEDGNYMVRDQDGEWKAIVLPHTELGLTAQSVQVMEDGELTWGEPVVKGGRDGRPLRPYDVSNDYKKAVKVLEWHQVGDGNYCVKRINPDDSEGAWTVWTADLLCEIKVAQGLE